MAVTFVETRAFTSRIAKLGLEEALRQLQLELLSNPKAGNVEKGTGGVRKVRMPDPGRGKGKRGGARVHYLPLPDKELMYLLLVYSKDEAESLTAAQKKELKAVVHAIKAAHASDRGR